MSATSARPILTRAVLLLLIYVAVVATLTRAWTRLENRNFLKATDDRLYVASRSLRYLLAEDFHDRAMDKDSISFEEELRNREKFNEFAKVNDLSYVYTVVRKDGGLFFSAPTVTDPDIPRLLNGDVQRIRQVLFNLVGNAVKYTAQGYVRLEISWLPYISPSGRGMVHFAVHDTGQGIPDDTLDAVFEPFTQADMAVNRSHGDTGIGLAIAKRLLLLMGSSLCMVSEEGAGSEFQFSLPLIPGQDDKGPR
jgi:signal transduction histidine kinase